MPVSLILSYVRGTLEHVPIVHWVFLLVLPLALTAILLFRRKHSIYSAICVGITVFLGLFLLDTAVLIRWFDGESHVEGISLVSEYHRLIQCGKARRAEMISNIAAFIPFGLFLFEFLASAKRLSAGRRLGLATLAGFGLSLCIECLQLVLRVGFFELTDLVMNTLGAFVGAGMAVVIRSLLVKQKKKSVTCNE